VREAPWVGGKVEIAISANAMQLPAGYYAAPDALRIPIQRIDPIGVTASISFQGHEGVNPINQLQPARCRLFCLGSVHPISAPHRFPITC
jgi:hypothetical protein